MSPERPFPTYDHERKTTTLNRALFARIPLGAESSDVRLELNDPYDTFAALDSTADAENVATSAWSEASIRL